MMYDRLISRNHIGASEVLQDLNFFSFCGNKVKKLRKNREKCFICIISLKLIGSKTGGYLKRYMFDFCINKFLKICSIEHIFFV